MALASILEPGTTVLAQLSRLAWAETAHPDGYLADLTEQLVRLLGVDMALVGVVDNARKSYRTIANYSASRGRLGAFEQELLGSAAAEVSGPDVVCVPRGALQRFPLDWLIREQGAEGFFGMPLFGASGDRIGVLALYHSGELMLDLSLTVRLEVIGQRASAELALHRSTVQKPLNSRIISAERPVPSEESAPTSIPSSVERISFG
ncbi:MAG: hypothetical protein QM784_35075 [Polyangiaceae bacterium]